MYTVKQIAEIAGVTVRTLHHYDDIGLLSPTKIGKNQYRYYDDTSLIRLQQILLYREIGVELVQIKTILDDPAFDVKAALRGHLQHLQQRMGQLTTLIETVQTTLASFEGEPSMSKKMFKGFSAEQQKDYEREARLEYGPENVNESVRRWESYTDAEKQAIFAEGNVIYTYIIGAIESNWSAEDERVQAFVQRWHQHIRYFYEPTLDILRGLPELYTTHPDFISNFHAMHPQLGEYMKTAVVHYVDDLETHEIQRMLEADSAAQRLQG